MEAHLKVELNEGSPTRAAMGLQIAGISAPDVSLVDSAMAYRFSWETISRTFFRPPFVAVHLG